MNNSSVVIEGAHSIVLAGPAEVIEEDKETAWAGPHVQVRPDFGWVLGRFVEADNPNENGHIFGLEDLRNSYKTVVHTPLNMLHRAHHVVGAYTAAEMLYPIAGAEEMSGDQLAAALQAARALDPIANPYVETLAAFWRYAFPDEYRSVVEAHKQGSTFFSMESVPESLKCPSCPIAGNLYAYRGLQSPTYCEHLNAFKSQKELIRPHFVGGAIIIPPTKPGWKKADIKQIADLITSNGEEADRIYENVAAQAPHLDSRQWEYVMALLLTGALGGAVPEDHSVTASRSRAASNEVPSVKDGIVLAHHTAVEKGPWDRGLMKRRIKTGDAVALRQANAWYDVTGADPDGDGLPDAKEDWKFIHHDVAADGTVGPANLTALRTGIGYLNGARNGTTIPEGDHQGVWNHLASHMRDVKEVAPPLHAGELDALDAADYSAEMRYKLAEEGKALPDGSFPIVTVEDLRHAVQAFGRAGDKRAARAHIIKRAKALGRTDLLPEEWKVPESAAAELPGDIYDAYVEHLTELDMKVSSSSELTASQHPFTGGTLWMVKDGWGEWFFTQIDDGEVEWAAQKWPDVMAYDVDDDLEITDEEVKSAGFGDDAWIKMLLGHLNSDQPSAQ